MIGQMNGAGSANAEPAHKPIPKTRGGKKLSERDRRREYERRMERDLATTSDKEVAPFKAMLFALHDTDAATRMWMQIEPILRSGPEGVRKKTTRLPEATE